MLIVLRAPWNAEILFDAVRDIVHTVADGHAKVILSGIRSLPPLYSTHVRYQPEPNSGKGVEEWADPWTVVKRGWGDCDDLVIYRIAELRAAGEHATCIVRRRGKRMHVKVRRASGAQEDPSRLLMR
jgi:hypothetical protein